MIEDEIVPTVWADKDYDIVVQSIIDKKLGLEGVDELELVPKAELPEWDKDDYKRMNDFKKRLDSGELRLMDGRL